MAHDDRSAETDELLHELDELPVGVREERIAELPPEAREGVLEAELDRADDQMPDDYEDLGAGD